MSVDNNVREIHRAASDLRRLQQRTETPLWHRLQKALARVALLSTVSASALETKTRHGKNESTVPPDAPQLDVSGDLFVIAARLAAIERTLDVYQGFTNDREGHQLLTFEKDRFILEECVGATPEDLSEAYPWLGSPRAIRLVRTRDGKHGTTGVEREMKAA